MIRRRARDLDEVDAPAQEEHRQRSANVTWDGSQVKLPQREQLNGHKAAVLWFTGLSGSGKSTIARTLERRLYERGCRTFYLDGDNLRHGLNGDLGFSDADRKENIRRVGEVAKLGYDHGNLTLCSFISPFRSDRDFARALLPAGRFLEVFVKCDLEVLKRRDPKGLYAKALAGELKEFTGISSPYEAPNHPELVVESDVQSVDEIVEKLIELLMRQGLI